MAKTKQIELVPDVIRSSDAIHVVIRLTGCANVSVKRYKGGNLLKPRWVAGRKAVVSWSGGGGNETPETAELMARALRWASSIARNLNVRNPDKLAKDDITLVHY